MSDDSTSSTDTPIQPQNSFQPPFVLELRAENLQPSGTFTPQAAVLITPALRQSGLLRTLSPDDFKLLISVLSAVTDNGSFAATPELLAPAIGLSAVRLRERLQRLTERIWQGEPLLKHHQTASGLHQFSPVPSLLAVRHRLVFPDTSRPGTPLVYPEYLERHTAVDNVVRGGFREAIIAHSRARYTRPRAEVEAQINRFLGWEPPQPKEVEEIPTTPEEETRLHLKRQLLALGIAQEEALLLLDTYPPAHIQRQLDWLPHRHARNPAGFLLAAIEGDYEAPLTVRLQQLKGQEAIEETNEKVHTESSEKAPDAKAPENSPENVVTQETGQDAEIPKLNSESNGGESNGEEAVLLELPPAHSGVEESDAPVTNNLR